MCKICIVVALLVFTGCKIDRPKKVTELKVVEPVVVDQSSSDPSSPNIHRGLVEGVGVITQKSSGTNSPNIVVGNGGTVIINGKEVK